MIGKKRFNSKIFYNFSLDKVIPEDDFYRGLDGILKLNFLYRECRGIYGRTGNPSIDPVVFFKIMIIGYLENIIYDRELARRINDSLSIRYFLGYDIDEQTPAHSTISKTRKRIPEDLFKKVFEYMLRLCISYGLVEGSHLAVDSTLSKANASIDNMERKKPKYTADEYIIKIRDEEKKRNQTHESKTDPDSKLARKPGKPVDLYYKNSVSVDTKKGIIIEPDTTLGNVNDSKTIGKIVKNSKDCLEDNGKRLRSIAADNAYCTGKALKALEEMEVEAYMPVRKQTRKHYKIPKEQFKYDEQKDCYICPEGKVLEYQSTIKDSKRYTSKSRDCKECKKKKDCIGKSNRRMIFEAKYRKQFDKLEKRMRSNTGKKLMKERKKVERVFGELKNNLGVKKVNTIGLENAKKKFIMAAFTYNLKKLLKYIPKKMKITLAKEKLRENFNKYIQNIELYGYVTP